jgi:isopenicillin-N N-acyltransferase-like protein
LNEGADLRVIEVSGTSGSMGAKLGEECKDLAQNMMAALKARLKLTGMDMGKGRSLASKFFPYAEAHDPEYVEFLEGYAEAANLSFDDLFVHFCLDEKGFCTDLAVNGDVTLDGSVLSAHTEDWGIEYAGHVVLIRARPRTGPRFMALSLCGAEIDCGMNSEGISFTGNSLYQDDMRVGVPKMFNARGILASRSMGEALRAAFPEKRASSYNHNLCHRSGEMYSVEGSATDFSVIPAVDGWLVHTNHYLSDAMLKHETVFSSPSGRSPGTAPSTLLRYHRATRLLREHLGDVSVSVLKTIMEDHFNLPRSICCHVEEDAGPDDRYATIFSVVFDLSRLEAHVCPTNPCKGKYGVYPLDVD